MHTQPCNPRKTSKNLEISGALCHIQGTDMFYQANYYALHLNYKMIYKVLDNGYTEKCNVGGDPFCLNFTRVCVRGRKHGTGKER